MNRFLCLLITCSLVAGLTWAQDNYNKKENYIWITPTHDIPWYMDAPYGHASDIDFNTTPFTSMPVSGTYTIEGTRTMVASICDDQGQLLFYTDGNIVWNRLNNVMEKGWAINDNGSYPYHLAITNSSGVLSHDYYNVQSAPNMDGVVIVPVPGQRSKYYIFSIVEKLGPILDPFGNQAMWGYAEWEGNLRYTIVDMEQDHDLGAVDTLHRGIVFAGNMSGNLHIVNGEDCNYWLVGNYAEGGFRSFNITANGIDTNPVVSTVVIPLQPYCQELNLSPDRRTLAEAFGSEVSVCHFDPATGIVTDYTPGPVILGAQNTQSIAFSPGSNHLYLGGIIGIRQYDISGAVPSFIYPPISVNGALYVESEYYTALRLAPDNKIYFNFDAGTQSSGGTINHPELTGAACELDSMEQITSPMFQRIASWILPAPNEVAVIRYDTLSNIMDQPICFQDSFVWLNPLPASFTGTDFRWRRQAGAGYPAFGNDSQSVAVDAPGVYTVSYFTSAPCVFHQDTFIVERRSFSLSLAKDLQQSFSCDGTALDLAPYTDAKSPHYLWLDGSEQPRLQADSTGMYRVTVTSEGCTASDSVYIYITDVRQRLPDDTVLCMEDQELGVPLKVRLPGAGARWEWSTGAADTALYAIDTGWYWLRVTDSMCVGTDSFYLDRRYCDCPLLFPTAFSPNSDGRNDTYRPAWPAACDVYEYKLEIYNRWGERVFIGYQEEGWDGTYNGRPADIGTYFYRVQVTAGLEQRATTKSGSFVLLR